MAATELRKAWVRTYLGLWGITAAGAVLVLVSGSGVGVWVRGALGLRLAGASRPSIARALGIWAHNTPIAAWPVLLGPLELRRGGRIADLLVLACLVVNVAPVGAALAAYGPRLLAYLPQLPLEWAGLAMGPAWWIARRRGRATPAWVGFTALVLLAAAVIETWVAR